MPDDASRDGEAEQIEKHDAHENAAAEPDVQNRGVDTNGPLDLQDVGWSGATSRSSSSQMRRRSQLPGFQARGAPAGGRAAASIRESAAPRSRSSVYLGQLAVLFDERRRALEFLARISIGI
jgi:hypothetical protein